MHADSMPLTPGSSFGRYQVLSALGAGGMGEVAGSDPDRVGRFVQESRAASALTHPSVAVVYDAGECDGHHYIAMEHVEGRSPRSRPSPRSPTGFSTGVLHDDSSRSFPRRFSTVVPTGFSTIVPTGVLVRTVVKNRREEPSWERSCRTVGENGRGEPPCYCCPASAASRCRTARSKSSRIVELVRNSARMSRRPLVAASEFT
jgi:hypothetical protein